MIKLHDYYSERNVSSLYKYYFTVLEQGSELTPGDVDSIISKKTQINKDILTDIIGTYMAKLYINQQPLFLNLKDYPEVQAVI